MLGFRVEGLGFWGLGLRVEGLGFRVEGLGFRSFSLLVLRILNYVSKPSTDSDLRSGFARCRQLLKRPTPNPRNSTLPLYNKPVARLINAQGTPVQSLQKHDNTP